MMTMLMFSLVATALVYLAGRRDAAKDPRLTGTALFLVAVFPLIAAVLPKVAVLPSHGAAVNRADLSWMPSLYGIWAAGFGVAALRLSMAAWGLGRWYRRSRLIDRRERIEIRELGGLKGPVAAGVFRPVVFVPEAWNRWPERVRSIVLDHECAHHERRDVLWRWMAEIAAAANWFNPLVWWMRRRLTVQCEYACDSRVVRNGVASGEYARVLCDLAEDSVFRGPAMAMAERSSLEERVKRLVGDQARLRVVSIPVMILMTVAAAASMAILGPKTKIQRHGSLDEARIRWTADPFPG